MSESLESNVCHAASEQPWTWRQRLRARLFPCQHCFAPPAPAEYEDCVTVRSVTSLDWIDRLRVLVTGVVVTESRTVTEHEVGNTVTASVCFIGTKRDLLP